jgi:hypothetical protein
VPDSYRNPAAIRRAPVAHDKKPGNRPGSQYFLGDETWSLKAARIKFQ